MIRYQVMTTEQVSKLAEIDRSELIALRYEMHGGKLVSTEIHYECPRWDPAALKEIQDRYIFETSRNGLAVGAFDEELLVGFGVLEHRFRGAEKDQLQIDLLYVSRDYRKQGIGTTLLNRLSDEARKRGATYLYISSAETFSAVTFYTTNGARITDKVDEELYRKEPGDIHMLMKL